MTRYYLIVIYQLSNYDKISYISKRKSPKIYFNSKIHDDHNDEKSALTSLIKISKLPFFLCESKKREKKKLQTYYKNTYRNQIMTRLKQKQLVSVQKVQFINRKFQVQDNNSVLNKKIFYKQSHSVKKGSISILHSKDYSRSLKSKSNQQLIPQNLSLKAKYNLRIQLVEKILQKYQAQLNGINDNKIFIFQWINHVGYINKQQFDYIFSNLPIKLDQSFIDKIYSIIDFNHNGTICLNDMIDGFDLFREHNYVNKLTIFFDLCDENQAKYIDQEKIQNLMRKNLQNADDKIILQENIEGLIRFINPKQKQFITKDEIQKAYEMNGYIKQIINQNLYEREKDSKNNLDVNYLQNNQYTFNKVVYFPYMDKLIQIIDEKQQIQKKQQEIKLNFQRIKQFMKEDSSDSNSNISI